MRIRWAGLIAAMVPLAGCATVSAPPPTLAGRVGAAFAAAPGTRFGLSVTDMAGRDIVAIDADARFVPASNVKLLTTAAAYVSLPGIDRPDLWDGTAVRLAPRAGGGPPDLVLVGGGDPGLSDRPGCVADCLATLADAVARTGIRTVGDVVGDDRLYADERWGPGWAVDDMQTGSGAAVSALAIDDDVVGFDVVPGAVAGAPATIAWRDGERDVAVRDEVVTVAEGKADVRIDRPPGTGMVRVYGTVPLGAAPERQTVALDDPAAHAAAHLRRLIEARGVRVGGTVRALHRPPSLADEAATPVPVAAPAPVLARLRPAPLADDIRLLLKTSQNLHAELLLRRIGTGSSARGLAVVTRMLAEIGVPRAAYDLADGSGLSGYDRVTPRAMTMLLRWAAGQPWGATWRAALPVGGVDGTLAHRFRGTALEGRIFAKTGTLSGTNALSGYLVAASGRTLAFALFANDRPWSAGSALPAIDAALLAVAAAN